MSYRKKPERRTFLQDRFDILIKRQKSGEATFTELTELDDIVNRDPEIREKVIRESLLMEVPNDFNGPVNDLKKEDDPYLQPIRYEAFTICNKKIFIQDFHFQNHHVKKQAIGLSSKPNCFYIIHVKSTALTYFGYWFLENKLSCWIIFGKHGLSLRHHVENYPQ